MTKEILYDIFLSRLILPRKVGIPLTEVHVKKNESFEKALKRFKEKCYYLGLKAEMRKREHYEKPSVRRKKRQIAAIRRERARMKKEAQRNSI